MYNKENKNPDFLEAKGHIWLKNFLHQINLFQKWKIQF